MSEEGNRTLIYLQLILHTGMVPIVYLKKIMFASFLLVKNEALESLKKNP